MTTLIGTNPDQIPVNSMLGGMAYQDPDNVSVGKITYSGTLLGNGDVVFGGSSTIWTSTGRTSLNVNGTSSSIISLSTGGSVNTSGYLYWDNLNFDIQNNTDGGWVRIGTKDYPNALIISSSGNLGLGVTPSTWTAGYKAFEFGYNSLSSGDNANIHLTLNGYYNAGWKYKNNGNSNLYSQINGGGHVWYTAPSGTAGAAVTFTQAMSLDSSNLTLSGTGATKLQEGTTAQRPASPQEGMIRKNSTTGRIESYIRGAWKNLSEEGAGTPVNLFDNAGFCVENRPRATNSAGANTNLFITDRWNWVSDQSSVSTNVNFATISSYGSESFFGEALVIANNTAITVPSTAQNYFEQTVMVYPINIAAGFVTLSFKAGSNVTGTFPVCIIHLGFRFLSSFTISETGTLKRFTIKIPVHPLAPSGSDSGFYRVTFPMGFGSSFDAPYTGLWENTSVRAATSGTTSLLTLSPGTSLYFAEMQLEAGEVATPFIRKDPSLDLLACLQHYQSSVLPMAGFAGTVEGAVLASPAATTNYASFGTIQLRSEMFYAPSITVYNPTSGADGTARNITASSDVAVQILASSIKAFSLRVNNVSVTANSEVYAHWSAETGY